MAGALHREIGQPAIERIERRLGLTGRNPGAQAAQHRQPGVRRRRQPVGRHKLGLKADRQPEVGNRPHGLAEKLGRSHADHSGFGSIDVEDLSQRRRAARELAAPEGVAEHDHRRRRGAVIVFRKDAARARRHPENPEVVSRDDRPFDRAERSTPPEHRLAQREIAHREQSVEHLLPGGEFPIERVAHVDRLIVFQQLNLHQRTGVAHRKRPEDHRVQHLINRRIRTDAKRERQHRGRRENRIVPQLAERVHQVLRQVVEEREDAHPCHGSLRRSRAIISTVRDQLSVSAVSFFRPVRVIE